MILKPLRRFLQWEPAPGLLLFFASLAAFSWANSHVSGSYFAFKASLEHTVNDGLMTLFFLLMTFEIKREMVSGELASFQKSALPVAAALGGMLLPAGIYVLFNHGSAAASGWGIPMATDIAFALAALTLLGKRVPAGLKIFLIALAIIDDLGAILVIALFYSQQIHVLMLVLSAACLAVLFLLNQIKVSLLWPYLLLGFLLWFFLLRSGIHATMAGVALAFLIPSGKKDSDVLEHLLQPWVNFVILPLFALVAAGVALVPETRGLLFHPVGLGILLGLCLGKPVGILSFSWLAVRFKLGALPRGVRWKALLGAGVLGGIGFTMSLFIAELGLPGAGFLDGAKLAVFCASLISGFGGFGYLWLMGRKGVT